MLVTVIFVLMASLSLMFAATNAVTGSKKDLRLSQDSRKSYFLGEAGTEDVLLRLKRGLAVSQPTEVVLIGTSSSTVSVLETPTGKEVTALGVSGEALRTIRASVASGDGIAFAYAVHVGTSGLTMNSSSRVNGTVYTNGSITGFQSSQIQGDAYAAGTISSPKPTITGVRQPGAPVIPLPEVDIQYWKDQANINNDPYVGNLAFGGSSNNLLGPKKIQGNLTLNNSARLTIRGPLHITGNLELNSSSDLYIDESFGSAGTVIVVDGVVRFNSSADIHSTSANPKGYILLLCAGTGTVAEFNSSASAGVLVHAPNGTIQINSSAHAAGLVGKGLTLNSSATVDYDVGLAGAQFSAGPSGGFEISSWGEVE